MRRGTARSTRALTALACAALVAAGSPGCDDEASVGCVDIGDGCECETDQPSNNVECSPDAFPGTVCCASINYPDATTGVQHCYCDSPLRNLDCSTLTDGCTCFMPGDYAAVECSSDGFPGTTCCASDGYPAEGDCSCQSEPTCPAYQPNMVPSCVDPTFFEGNEWGCRFGERRVEACSLSGGWDLGSGG